MGWPLLFGLGGAYGAGQHGLFSKAADFYKNQLVPSVDNQLQQSGGRIPGGPTVPVLNNAIPDSVRFTGNRNDPITVIRQDGTVGTVPMELGVNGTSATDIAPSVVEDQVVRSTYDPYTESVAGGGGQIGRDAMTRGMNAYNQIDPIIKQDADTDRKRDRTSFGEMLMSRMNQADPGMLTPAEKLIRTGGAIVGAADQGGLAAMEAAGNTYGAIQDYERAQQQQQIENYINSLTSSGQLTGQQQSDLVTEIGGYEDQLRMMDTALTGLEGATDITGPIAGTWGSFWDPRSTDDKKRARATIRLQLKRLRVSNILENTKNTKGAISDKEMALFAEDSPTMDMQEGVWIDFITRRRDVLRRVVYRLKNNIRVDPKTGIEYSADGQEIASTTNTTPQYSQEDMDTLNKYGLGQ